MKLKLRNRPVLLLSITFVLSLLLGLTSCKPDEDDPGTGSATDTLTKATFTVYYLSSDTGPRIEGAIVGMTVNETDRDDGSFILSRTTDAFGLAKFSSIGVDTWYYRVSWVDQNLNTLTRDGSFEIDQGQKILKTIVLK